MAQVIQGYAALWNVKHWYWKNERFEVFDKNCFAGSLWGLWLCRDHRFTERKIADQDKGTLEILENETGLAFRATLNPGDVEWIDGRSEVSVSYLPKETETRDGLHVIKSAVLLELSLCHVATLRSTHAIVCNANSVGTLAHDAKNGFANDAAFTKVMAALKRLENS